MQQSYASFNATVRDVDTGNTSSPTQQQRFGPLNLDTSMPSYQDIARQQQNAKTPGFNRAEDGSYGFTRGAVGMTPGNQGKLQPVSKINTPGIVSDAVNSGIKLGTSIANAIKEPGMSDAFKETATAGQKATAFMSGAGGAAVNAAAGLVGSALNTVGSMVGQYADRPEAQQLNETQEAVRSGIYSAVSAVPV